MDEGKFVIEVDEVEVWSFVIGTARPFHINALKSQVQFSIAGVDDTALPRASFGALRMRADKVRLGQVLRNFLSNAVKFAKSPGGEVKVVVDLIHDEKGRQVSFSGQSGGVQTVEHFVRVSVTDNGCGISKENQGRLFAKYVQFNAGALQKGGGSGLGLWIAKSKEDS
jgi:signal transduction histidine kinase